MTDGLVVLVVVVVVGEAVAVAVAVVVVVVMVVVVVAMVVAVLVVVMAVVVAAAAAVAATREGPTCSCPRARIWRCSCVRYDPRPVATPDTMPRSRPRPLRPLRARGPA